MTDRKESLEKSERSLGVACHGVPCGRLVQTGPHQYKFTYLSGYKGPPISLTMPVKLGFYDFDRFPPFFDGLLPEGGQLDALIRQNKIDAHDYMAQLEAVGADLVGAVTVINDSSQKGNEEEKE